MKRVTTVTESVTLVIASVTTVTKPVTLVTTSVTRVTEPVPTVTDSVTVVTNQNPNETLSDFYKNLLVFAGIQGQAVGVFDVGDVAFEQDSFLRRKLFDLFGGKLLAVFAALPLGKYPETQINQRQRDRNNQKYE